MILLQVGVAASIDGSVLEPNGEGAAGAIVRVYDQRYSAREVSTDANGQFQVSELPAGTWRVRVIPPRVTAGAETWWGGGMRFCEGNSVELDDDGSHSVVVDLQPGGRLSGYVFEQSRLPLEGATVGARPTWWREVGVAERAGTVDSEGWFEIMGLPAASDGRDTVMLEVTAEGLPTQFHRGRWTEREADPIELPPGGDVEVSDFSVYPGATLTGEVVGEGASTGTLFIYDGLRTSEWPILDGTFTAEGLRAEPWLVWAVVPGFARTYWPDATVAGELVHPGLGGSDATATLTLQPAGALEGRLVGLETFGQVAVLAVNDTQNLASAVFVAPDGSFRIDDLAADDWSLELYAYDSGLLEGAIPETAVSVEVGNTTDLGEVTVRLGASLVGTITDPYTGLPVFGAAVSAVDELSGLRITASTDRGGQYVVRGIPAGAWTLEADYAPYCGSDADWVTVNWPGSINPAVRGTVQLALGEQFAWDIAMPRDTDGDRMADGWELEMGLDPLIDDAEQDLDGDGFNNLVEYRLGTDANAQFEAGGCGCAPPGAESAPSAFPLLESILRRRRHAGATF